MTAADRRRARRWNAGGWLVAAAALLVAAGAFVGLLVWNRYAFLGAVALVATNTATAALTTRTVRRERDEARARIEALPPVSVTEVGDDLDPPPFLRPERTATVVDMWDPTGGHSA